jgi:hypothetical protein
MGSQEREPPHSGSPRRPATVPDCSRRREAPHPTPTDPCRRTGSAWHAEVWGSNPHISTGKGSKSKSWPEIFCAVQQQSTAAKYSSKVQQRRTSAAAHLFGFGLCAEYPVGPRCCYMRLGSRVGSRNAMIFLNAASRGPYNGWYGEARRLADLSVYLPLLQQVSCSADGAANGSLLRSAGTTGRNQARAQRWVSGARACVAAAAPMRAAPDRAQGR